MSKYTSEQVRDMARSLDGQSRQMLNEYADLLRERESAKVAVTGGIVSEAFGAFAHALKDKATFEDLRAALVAVTTMLASVQQPIPMILYCPSCHAQHIDRIEIDVGQPNEAWMNPPHRSHLCHNCGTIWRPADVPTTGVERIQTQGKNDIVMPVPMLASARVPDGWQLVRVSDLQKIAAPVGTDMDSSTTNSYRAAIYHRELYERRSLAESMIAAAPKPEKE